MRPTAWQPERVRNRVLRRADWRFLLPDPAPGTSLCLAHGRLARAVAAISGDVRETVDPSRAICDLLVAVNPSRAVLQAATRALRPGGACYTEWYSPLTGGPPAIRRRLEAAGLEDIACYSPWPWLWPILGGVQLWLPLDALGASRRFLAAHEPTCDRIGRAALSVGKAIWRQAVRLGAAVPVCAIARKPARLAPRTADLNATVRALWTSRDFGPTPDKIAMVLLTQGHRSINKVVSLVFADSEAQPRLAVKLPRVPESVIALAREAAALNAVHGSRAQGMPGVPRVLLWREHTGAPALVETALGGTPLFTKLGRENYRDLALAATSWLVILAGQAARRPPSVWQERLVAPVLAEFRESFGAVVDHGLLRETAEVLAKLPALPLVCEQRDFSPWNVLVAPDRELVVLDWESAEPAGLPALDLLYFLSYLAFFLDGAFASGRYRECYRATLARSTFTGGVRHECLALYAAALDLEPTELLPLRVLLWLLHARSEYQRMVADTAGRPGVARLRSSLFVGLWEEEIRDVAR